MTAPTAIDDMLAQGMLEPVSAGGLDTYLGRAGLAVLFFAGSRSHAGYAQDVSVALRELLKEYPGQISAALVAETDQAALQERFRVLAFPSLALVLEGETLEVIPRVRDWADYARVFRRYLGNPAPLQPA